MLDEDAFALLLGTTRDDMVAKCGSLIRKFDFAYDILEGSERESVFLRVMKAIEGGTFSQSGKARKADWERGWKENLDSFTASRFDLNKLAPRYISKYDVSRLQSEYVRPHDRMFELNFYTVYRQYLFRTYLSRCESIFEFGCGTGYNLVIMHSLFPNCRITGLDWSESAVTIANELGKKLKAQISGRAFDYFDPDGSLDIPPNSAVITLNSLEQVGRDHDAFLRFLMEKKPSVCINAEPFIELYDQESLFDYLAARYHTARNYLSGYLESLKRLEDEGRARILKIQRVSFGNLYHEGYSFVVWHPTDIGA